VADLDNRAAPAPDADAEPIGSVKVEFQMAIFLTPEDQLRICHLFDEIVQRPYNQPADGVHWVSGVGAEPHLSAVDAAFLGAAPAPADVRPADGEEPTFDHSVFHLSTTARPFVSERERDRALAKRNARG
jgi:hypothetical protein